MAKRFASRVLSFSLLAVQVQSLLAEDRFPVEAFPTGELVKGFQFWDLSSTNAEKQWIEVMVTTSDGVVVFPAETKFSTQLLQHFFRTISEGAKEDDSVESRVIELVSLMTPKSVSSLRVYPELERKKVQDLVGFLEIDAAQFEEKVAEWRARAAKLQSRVGMKDTRVIANLAGNTLREFEVTLDPGGVELRSVSVLRADGVFVRPEGKAGGEANDSVLPIDGD